MKQELSPTQRAIQQKKPFRSDRQEAAIALMLAAEAIQWPATDLLTKQGDLTPQQYNVLRILRGAGDAGLPTLDIAGRMIQRTPGITRLIDRLESKKLVQRERSDEDRRQVVCRITRPGRELLARLDAPVERLEAESLGQLSAAEVKALLRLLERIHGG
jgi:DNA-binding MarR family transcriptional regulator